MPVVVDEVVVAVEVGGQSPGGPASALSSAEAQQLIVNQCVERVLDVLRQKSER